MASATEVLTAPTAPQYDTSSPMSYDQWKKMQIDYSKGDFGDKLGTAFGELGGVFGIGSYGRKSYQNYVDDFYNKQAIKNTGLSEKYQKDYEEYMSSTAIQRQFEDARKAGLNPIYAILNNANGASTPSSANAITRSSSSSRSSSESNSRSTSNSATAVIAALIFLLSKGLLK